MAEYDWKIYRLGNTERWYDRHCRCWFIRTVDADGNQVGTAQDCGTKAEAVAIQAALAKPPKEQTCHRA